MKRFLSILLVAVLALGLMATSAFAAGISVEKTGEATVTLKATDVTFQSCLATINFDHDKLELTDVKAGEILPSGTKDVSKVTAASEVEGVNSMFAWNADNAGKAMIAYACGSDISSNGIVFTLTFKLKDGVEKAEVNAAVTFYDENNKDGDKIVPIETSTSAPAIIEVKASGTLKRGDVDGDTKVTSKDALFAALLANGTYTEDTPRVKNYAGADVDGDGKVTSKDALWIALYANGNEKFVSE